MRKIHPQGNNETFYDIFEDWGLIEASFWKQYGIRLRNSGEDDLSWPEFCSLLGGIMYNTPLGAVVSIRAETDKKIIKNFTKEQRRIRNDWLMKRNRKRKENGVDAEYWKKFQDWAKNCFLKT